MLPFSALDPARSIHPELASFSEVFPDLQKDKDLKYKKTPSVSKNYGKKETQAYFAGQYSRKDNARYKNEEVEIDAFYYYVLDRGNLAPTTLRKPADTPHKRAFFLTLLHVIMLQDPHKTFEGTFSERLLNDSSKDRK